MVDTGRHKNALSKSNAHFANPKGDHLFNRLDTYAAWINDRREYGYWHYSRQLGSLPTAIAEIGYLNSTTASGINLAVQDYLGLSTHKAIHEAAIAAVQDFGVHSAGSAMLLGNSPASLKLERKIAAFVNMDHILLFPTGWAAGFGAVKGLVREYDHVVMDSLSHACLQEGAKAASKNIHRYKHLDVGAAIETITRIRASDRKNGILVVSEGIFSMDSDTPDLLKLQEACREYRSVLLVDVAHDLGSIGPAGTGQIGIQGLFGKIDLIVGAFSKTFASNGGFVATSDENVKKYLQWFANPHTFSNALSPIQCAVVGRAIDIVQSQEGDDLRSALSNNANIFRDALIQNGLQVLGLPSAIVPVMIGKESIGRRAGKLVNDRRVFTNMVEFPAVGLGAARFRCQLMASHERGQLLAAASAISTAIAEARKQAEFDGDEATRYRDDVDAFNIVL